MTQELDDSPWKDPHVVAALNNGRPPSDIALLGCPKCGAYGYYNQGSHFFCRFCDQAWAVLCEDESPEEYEGRPSMYADDTITLEDFSDGAPDGYED